ncbi:MAG: hypothetical protein R3A79_23310 [Nannocystaceae bacterium]
MMPRAYAYVGPEALGAGAAQARSGSTIRDRDDLARWAAAQPEWDGEELTATFVVLTDGSLRVAPRRSEHVDCAQGAAVLAAGELTLGRGPGGVEVVAATNQSTGYCPEPDCWSSLRAALDAVAIPAPAGLATAYTFRRCPECGERNLVKEAWFVCDLCGADLPEAWNFA